MDSKTVADRAQHQPRLEDEPLVRGLGRFAADAPVSGQLQASFVRSPHAFADIRSIDVAAASAVPGVLAVLTAADMEGIGNVSQHPPLAGRAGAKLIVPHRPALAGKTVRHVGEAVAVVIAQMLTAAQDAAELVAVDYAERAPVVDVREAVATGAPQVWPEAPGNIAVDWPGLAADPDRQCRGGGARHRRGRARGKSGGGASADHGALDGAARGDRELRRRDRQLSAALLLAERAHAARRARADPRRRQGAPAGDHRGRGRGVRAQDRSLSRIPRHPGRGPQARPSGALDVQSRRGLPQRQSRARCVQRCRARARRARPFPGAARAPSRQHGRLYRRGRRQHPDRQSHALPARHVRHPADRLRHALRVHHHHPDRALSRRRPAGGELHPGAGDRRGRAGDRHRPGQAAPPQPDQARRDAVQDRGRHHHRQRRVRDGAGQGADARRLRRLQAAPARGGKARSLSRARHLLHAGACRRLPARRHRAELSRRREARARPQRAIDRAGPRHHVQSHAGAAARHRPAADRAPPRRLRAWRSPAMPRSARARR